MASAPTVRTGVLNTESERAWEDQDPDDLILTHDFPRKAFPIAPRIAIALKHFDLAGRTSSTKAIGVKAATESVENDYLNTRISVWGDGAMSSAGAAWIAYPATDNRFRSGVFKTTRRSGVPSSFPIKFDRPFPSQGEPTVLVWISGFQMDIEGAWDLNAFSTERTESSFTLVVETGDGTTLHQGLFSYLAFMPEEEGVAGGRVENLKMGDGEGTDDPDGSYIWATPENIAFGKKLEGLTHDRVMVGISSINLGGGGMRLKYLPVKINEDCEGMTLEAGTWWGTVVHSASMSWVAVA